MDTLSIGQMMFVAAIVKGLVENGDACRHFGSTLSFAYYESQARKFGLVGDSLEKLTLTEKGRDWYKRAELNRLPDTRATFWQRVEFPKP